MEEILKVRIDVTDEGIIFIDGLTADYALFDEAIDKYSVELKFASKNAYDSLYEGYKEYLNATASVVDIHKKLDFIEYIYKYQRELAKLAIGSTLKVIESASKILGISMADTYNEIVERLKLLNHD